MDFSIFSTKVCEKHCFQPCIFYRSFDSGQKVDSAYSGFSGFCHQFCAEFHQRQLCIMIIFHCGPSVLPNTTENKSFGLAKLPHQSLYSYYQQVIAF